MKEYALVPSVGDDEMVDVIGIGENSPFDRHYASYLEPEIGALLVSALKARDEECPRHPETAPDPQNTADGGQGIDIPSHLETLGPSNARGFEIVEDACNRVKSAMYAGVGQTPIDTAKTAIPEPVPPRTLGTESDPSDNGTQWRDIDSAPKDGTRVLVSRTPETGYDALRVGVDRWFRGQWWCSRRDMKPTHWQPLPKPVE